jgi:hypothetical protein
MDSKNKAAPKPVADDESSIMTTGIGIVFALQQHCHSTG